MNITIRVAVVDVLRVDSVEDLEPETTDKVAVPAVLALVVAVQAAAAVVVEVTAAAEDLVEVAMEASTVVTDMEGIITPRGLTGGAIKTALQSHHPFKQVNMETTCNLARLYRVTLRTFSTLPTVILLKIYGRSKSQEERNSNCPIQKLVERLNHSRLD